jgi:predicted glycosyltransferase
LNILIDIGHPGHVHLLRNLAQKLKTKGHKVFFSVKNKRNITLLLDAYIIQYTLLGKKYDNLFLKYLSSVYHLFRMFLLIRSKRINCGIGISGLIPVFSRYSSFTSICLDDDDANATPFFAKSISKASVILTPSALKDDSRGNHHITYDGYHELAYLHPNYFTPDPVILQELGVKSGEKYFILRFNAFKAHHDSEEYGLNLEQKQQLIELLEPHGKVFISTEAKDDKFHDYILNIPPQKIHSVLYYATILIGDSQTMCSEAAILGTPALKCNTFAGRLSIPNELEEKYGLCYAYKPDEFDTLLEKAEELLHQEDLHDEWQTRRQKMIVDKIDVTAFMAWFIENYPESIRVMKEEPEFQYRFR